MHIIKPAQDELGSEEVQSDDLLERKYVKCREICFLLSCASQLKSLLENTTLNQDLKVPYISHFCKHGTIPPKYARGLVRKEK